MKIFLILLAVVVLWQIAKRLLVNGLAGVFAQAVGKVALAQQPDRIALLAASPAALRDRGAVENLKAPLIARGFADAGTYHVKEMPGVLVTMLAKADESFYAAVYEHPQAGHWIDLVTRYQNGDSANFSTVKPSGLEPRPGHLMVHAPGSSPLDLYQRARAERPRGSMKPATVESAPRDFEAAYAEETAWRKRKGISACEVAEVARAA